MRILNIFDAAREGTFDDFKKFYSGNVNEVDKDLDINLLCMAVSNDKNPDEKIKIIKFLFEEGIDVNYVMKKTNRNALHLFYFNTFRPTVEYELKITKLLIAHGININATDKYGAIPLKYAITINKLTTEENKEMYQFLLENGADYNLKDVFDKSCLDYAKQYSWRNGFLKIVEDFKNENR